MPLPFLHLFYLYSYNAGYRHPQKFGVSTSSLSFLALGTKTPFPASLPLSVFLKHRRRRMRPSFLTQGRIRPLASPHKHTLPGKVVLV